MLQKQKFPFKIVIIPWLFNRTKSSKPNTHAIIIITQNNKISNQLPTDYNWYFTWNMRISFLSYHGLQNSKRLRSYKHGKKNTQTQKSSQMTKFQTPFNENIQNKVQTIGDWLSQKVLTLSSKKMAN